MKQEHRSQILELAILQIKADFNFIQENTINNGETLYAFAIGLVGQIAGFFSAGNTIESLHKVLEQNEFDPWYIWGVSEWNYEGNSGNKLSNYLGEYSKNIPDEDYEKELKEYEQIIINALQLCEEKNVFGTGLKREELIVYLQYADAHNEDVDDEVAQLINSKENYLLFKNRWEDERASLTKVVIDKVKGL